MCTNIMCSYCNYSAVFCTRFVISFSYEMRRYKKQALYEIENVVVVDLKATNMPKAPLNLIQLLVFPDIRVFQIESIKAKRALISTIDEAKRLHLIGVPVDDGDAAPGDGEPNTIAFANGSHGDANTSINGETSTAIMGASPEVDTLCFEALAGTIPEIADFIRRERPSTAGTSTGRVNRTCFFSYFVDSWVLYCFHAVCVLSIIRPLSVNV